MLSSFLNAKGRQLKTCSACRDKGRNAQKKSRAKKKASGVKHQCPKCDYKCSTKSNLTTHIKMIHDKIKDIQCPKCDYKCSTNGSLNVHIKRVHDKIKNLECPKCDSKFSTKSNLNAHIKQVHDKIKDFECPNCDSKFSTKGSLTRHIKQVHDKIKDFECPECDSKFSQKGNLTKHIKQVHNKIKDFECPNCDSKFSTKGSLTRHIKRCTGELKMSAGEFKIMNTLKSMMIEFKREYTIADLKSSIGGTLRYDFYLPKYGLYIEYDGKQHYEPVRFGGVSKKKALESFHKTQANDKIKNEYAGNKLLRIKYTNYLLVPELVFKFITDKTDWDSDERH